MVAKRMKMRKLREFAGITSGRETNAPHRSDVDRIWPETSGRTFLGDFAVQRSWRSLSLVFITLCAMLMIGCGGGTGSSVVASAGAPGANASPAASPTPTPSTSASKVIDNVQDSTSWLTCGACGNGGGTGPVATFAFTPGIATPSESGRATNFSIA